MMMIMMIHKRANQRRAGN